jgi:hypothetical protein
MLGQFHSVEIQARHGRGSHPCKKRNDGAASLAKLLASSNPIKGG